jgi:hypothetical protein
LNKPCAQPSKTKTTLTAFFNSRGLVHKEFVPQGLGQTVHHNVYNGVLESLCKSIQCHRPELWETVNWLILHDIAWLHMALSTKELLSVHQLTALLHAPYSPEMSPDYFFCFSRLN